MQFSVKYETNSYKLHCTHMYTHKNPVFININKVSLATIIFSFYLLTIYLELFSLLYFQGDGFLSFTTEAFIVFKNLMMHNVFKLIQICLYRYRTLSHLCLMLYLELRSFLKNDIWVEFKDTLLNSGVFKKISKDVYDIVQYLALPL